VITPYITDDEDSDNKSAFAEDLHSRRRYRTHHPECDPVPDSDFHPYYQMTPEALKKCIESTKKMTGFKALAKVL
jgi:hypothetical protein